MRTTAVILPALLLMAHLLPAGAADVNNGKPQIIESDSNLIWRQLLEPHNALKPITITSQAHIDASAGASLSGAWLAGLATTPDSAPTALALCWAPTSAGWFGERWGLQIASTEGLLPNELRPEKGSGFLDGAAYITLADAAPVWGHRYETTLSYHPATGALAVQVMDLTDSTRIYSGAIQANALRTTIYPGAGFMQVRNDTPYDLLPAANVESLTAEAIFKPLHATWGLIQPRKNGILLSTYIDRRMATSLRITTPWLDLPGEWMLKAAQDQRQLTLLQPSKHRQDALFALEQSVVSSLPAGKVTLTLEHKDENQTTFSDEASLAVGVLHASIDALRTNEDNTITGKLIVTSDGPIGKVPTRLKATMTKLFYDRDDRGVLKPTEQPLAQKSIIDVEITPSPQPLEIPFKLDIAEMTPANSQYVDGRLVLEPEFIAPDGVSIQAKPETMSIALGQPSFTIDPGEHRQTIDGFGASGAWWAQVVGGMSDPMRNKVADLLFSMDKGIGLSQYRYNIGGGIDADIPDPWRTAETFEVAQGVYDWSRDANARWFLQAAKERGVRDFVLFAVSPPARITRSGHTYNKNKLDANIAPEMYSQFAQYLVDIWKHFRDDEGITFNTVSPFNEPEWAWEGGNQEGTPLTLQQTLSISRAVATAFQSQGVPAKLLIPEAGAWEFLYGKGRWYADMIAADPLLAANSILAIHSYWTTDAQRKTAGQYMSRYPNQRVWQTEWCEMLGGRDYGMGSALTLAHTVYADLTLANVSAWQHWVAVDRYDHRDSLIYTEYFKPGDTENIDDTKKLWALGNFSRFVRPGAVRIDVESNYASPGEDYRAAVLMSAFHDTEHDKLVIVAINQSEISQTIQMILPAGAPDVSLTPYRTSDAESLQKLEQTHLKSDGDHGQTSGAVTLPPLSITTFVADYQLGS